MTNQEKKAARAMLENRADDVIGQMSQVAQLMSANGIYVTQDVLKRKLLAKAYKEIADAVSQGYYSLEDLKTINFSEICEWCGWPNFQDGGIFEQCIVRACEDVAWTIGYDIAKKA